ncbi:hypothetical protein OZX61_12645 (plasmid) [Acinetobacter sp. ESL0695]|uniref:hypothetical protein n=1 Tax=Acinetobacter sp. ESL0695 TaxID=2983215 RepID=UPI0023F0BFAF|nr:hypothetical protein [Acinetobacter sp. ESL0695]WEV50241.1 hypothetical protein OZX61_12645 [Acinetobacter sp. ESL0695]
MTNTKLPKLPDLKLLNTDEYCRLDGYSLQNELRLNSPMNDRHFESSVLDTLTNFAFHLSDDFLEHKDRCITYIDGMYYFTFVNTAEKKYIYTENCLNYFSGNLTLLEFSFLCNLMTLSNLSIQSKDSQETKYLVYRYNKVRELMLKNKDQLDMEKLNLALA